VLRMPCLAVPLPWMAFPYRMDSCWVNHFERNKVSCFRGQQEGFSIYSIVHIFSVNEAVVSLVKRRPSITNQHILRIAITNDMAPRESERPQHRERSHHHAKRKSRKSRYESASSQSGSQLLSADALSKFNQLNQQSARSAEVTPKKTRRKRHREIIDEKIVVEKRRDHKRSKRRVVSGALLEEGDSSRLKGLRGGERYEKDYVEEDDGRKRKRLCRLNRKEKAQHC
jgi:hypothetical protein